MKKTIGVLAIYAGLGLLAAPVFASVLELEETQAQAQCTEEAKGALYTDFTKFRTTEAAKAYEAGKKYLACAGDKEDQYTTYIKKWVTAYDKEARKLQFQPKLYNEKKYPEAFALGKEILADEPENLRILIDMGYGNYLAALTLKNESYNNDALMYSKKAIQLIESGKAPESWAPFKSKEDTLAYLYNGIGRITVKTNPAEALTALIKSAQFESDVKKDPWTYYFVAASYETGPYAMLSADYKTKFAGKDETPESKLALENINQIIDTMIDAYARAVALAGNDAKYAASKKDWMEGLSTWYKYRHNQSDAGLTEMIASVLLKPLPPMPTPLTSLPTAAPATTAPASGGTSSTGSPSTTGASATPTTTTTTPTAPKTTPAATPTPTPTPATPTKPPGTSTSSTTPTKPKPKNNHRRH